MKHIGVIAMILFSFGYSAKGEDFNLVFGSDYQKADHWLKENEEVFEETGTRYNIPSSMLMAIVFPEIIRYNAVFDFIESTSLSLLYAGQGRKYADFSIGPFQMKPSFAEQIEHDVPIYLEKEVSRSLGFSSISLAENEKNRQDRISRIGSFEGQLNYLIAFYLICQTKFRQILPDKGEEQLKFLAACYNTGYQKALDEIKAAMNKEEFHTGNFTLSKRYNYSDISVFWYRKLLT
jgi:hypothetical protein